MSEEPDKDREQEADAVSEKAATDADAASGSADVPAADDAVEAPRPDAEPAADSAPEPVAEAEEESDDAEEPEAAAEDDDAEEPEAAAEDDDAEDDEDSDDDEDDQGTETETEAEAAAPAPSTPTRSRRRGGQRDPSLPAPVVRAQAKFVRSSARKARLVCDQFRGKSVVDARAILAVTPRAIGRDWSKLLESAIANAEHNHELVGEDLYVKAVHADEGPTIKRFQPRAKGRATRIRKRTSHLTILLEQKD